MTLDEEAALAAWEERAAIMEHDGGLSRAEAERAATLRVSLELGYEVVDDEAHRLITPAEAIRAEVEALQRGADAFAHKPEPAWLPTETAWRVLVDMWIDQHHGGADRVWVRDGGPTGGHWISVYRARCTHGCRFCPEGARNAA
jgi:hypothetical protein